MLHGQKNIKLCVKNVYYKGVK